MRRNEPITVIIPTRERCETLLHSLRSATSQNYERLTILVADNCSKDDTSEVVAAARDPRIRYIKTERRLSMSSNWENAVSNVTEGWVTVLGDDDALLPGAIERVASLAADSGTSAVRSTTCEYQWPSLTGNAHGVIDVPLSHLVEIRDSAKQLSRVLRGKASYRTLPMVYTGGFIHTSVLSRHRELTGSVFLSMTPDVYSGVAVAQLIDRFLFCGIPLVVNGASRHSNGSSFFRKERSTISDQPSALYFQEPNIPPHEAVAISANERFPPSLQLILLEAYMQSLKIGRNVEACAAAALQLRLIRREAYIRSTDIRAWEERFRAQHNLPAQHRMLETLSLRIEAAVWNGMRQAERLAIWRASGSPKMPLANVADAAAFAADLLASPPSRASAALACVARSILHRGARR